MTENPLRGLSAKDGLDDSGLLRTLIDSLPEHVYVKDAESRYVFNNAGRPPKSPCETVTERSGGW